MRTRLLILIFGCFVRLRKPEVEMVPLATDTEQVPVQNLVFYIAPPMFAQIAKGLGNRDILHPDYKSICAKLALLGLAE
jgi:hypothetical protein